MVPVICVRLSKERTQPEKATINIFYKTGAKSVTSRFPVIDVEYEKQQMELFAPDKEIELLIETHDKNNQVVGEAKVGGIGYGLAHIGFYSKSKASTLWSTAYATGDTHTNRGDQQNDDITCKHFRT